MTPASRDQDELNKLYAASEGLALEDARNIFINAYPLLFFPELMVSLI